jgi:hypothetical protein
VPHFGFVDQGSLSTACLGDRETQRSHSGFVDGRMYIWREDKDA